MLANRSGSRNPHAGANSTHRARASPVRAMAAVDVSVRVRRARSSDSARLFELVNGSYRGNGNWTHEQGLVSGPRLTLAEAHGCCALAEQEDAHSVVLVAETLLDGADYVVGCVEVTTTDAAASLAAPGDPPRDGYLGLLSVDARYGSLGIGRTLFAAGEALAFSHFRACAVVLFVLSVRADILAWYTRRGYVATGLSTDARSLIEGISSDAKLLVDAEFIILRRRLPLEAAPAC